jgi:hypothetical protein
MRPVRNRLVRFVALASLVCACLGVEATPAAAFVSTGTVTVEGGYYYYAYFDTTGPPYSPPQATLSIWTDVCSDTWAGTTTTGQGAGIFCWVQLFGWNPTPYTRLEMTGNYWASGSSGATYYLRLHGGPAALWNAGPGTFTGTASAYGAYYEGSAIANYTLTMLRDCNTIAIPQRCNPGFYWSEGAVTMTLDYVVQ